jgi:hypothetical protein
VPETDLTDDHRALTDDLAARRYFRKFGRITEFLTGVAGTMAREGGLSALEAEVLSGYIASISSTFRALSMKYLIAGRLKSGARHLTIDFHESGFPVFQEIVTLANDAAQSGSHLANLPEAAALKDGMVKVIVGERRVPVELQYALSQRLYFERLTKGGLFLAQMHPQAQWLEDLASGRRRFLIHWAVYDSQMNVPVAYLLEVEDSGRRALPKDEARWPALQAHLLAQSVSGLKLLTIAKGVDKDFDDIHPKRLRRLFLGPMYSQAFTLQTGPIREVLADARAGEGEDWALAWTVEELESERVEVEKGWFSATESEVFRLDPLSAAAESGASRVVRNLILPQRVYQVLAEKDPEGFRPVVKYVVGKDGRVMRA